MTSKPPSKNGSRTAEPQTALVDQNKSADAQQETASESIVASAQNSAESSAEKDVENSPVGETEEQSQTLSFPVIGIGASAGGLHAFEQFFGALPDDSGMAFVLVQHLAPHHESELAELLQNHTRMMVSQVNDGEKVEPNHVYVIPPGKTLSIQQGVLQLSEPDRPRGQRAPIDLFFRSLAEDQGENAVCIILSGTGSDGTSGLKAIKERAGITMAQSPKDAEYDGMPKSATNTNLVDVVGTAAELAQKLIEYKDSASRIQLPAAEEMPEDGSDALNNIFGLLRNKTGHDFTHYKRSTILRRIARRLQVTGLETIPQYVVHLRQNSDELQALFKDFLISVTNFFRDAEAFAALEKKVVPRLFQEKSANDTVRVWITGCATGEEAYSVAILLFEYASRFDNAPSIQVFATDIDEEAIAFAREGLYHEMVAADVSPERLQKFFTEESDGYRIKKQIRESILFANHNLINDPPFSRLDLITCRNLLIYLNRDLQEKVFELFHYALRPSGYLFLGSSEAADTRANLFKTVDKKHRLFASQETLSNPWRLPDVPLVRSEQVERDKKRSHKDTQASLETLYRDWQIRQYAPPALVVNRAYDVVHIFGNAGRYLTIREGPATHNVLEQVLPDLRLDLRTALYQVTHKEERVTSRRVPITIGNEEASLVRMIVGPVDMAGFPEDYVEVVFEELAVEPDLLSLNGAAVASTDGNELVARLEEELLRTKERLQTTIEEHETANEELKASNEELQSMNEEFRSTTEELETGKEELQSMNEELVTLNQELKNKIEELSSANSDLQNLMESTDIATIFLDRNLHIKRFTPRIHDLFNVITADIGRPFSHVSHKINYDGLPDDAARVLRRLEILEHEIESKDGRWFIVRILPYRTVDDRIEGVVITFFDVTRRKEIEQSLARREQQQATVASLGQLALQGMEIDFLLRETAQRLCDVLDLEFCDALESTDGEEAAEENCLLLRGGLGWPNEEIGFRQFAVGKNSQAHYVYSAQSTVIISDLATESRFTPFPHLAEHKIVSGMSIVIPGLDTPYGILSVYSKQPCEFSPDDTYFLQSVANLLAEAIARQGNEARIRQSEEKTRRALDELEAIYHTAPIGLCVLDAELRYLRINERLAEINGLPIDAHIGHTIREILPDLADEIIPACQRIFETGEPLLDMETTGETPAQPGVLRTWITDWLPLFDATGAVVGINVVADEVTERKRAEEELRYQAYLLDNVRDAIISTDLNFQILTWNRGAQETYGWTAAEAIGKRVRDLVSTTYLSSETSETAAASLLENGRWCGEVIQHHKNGTPIHISNSTLLLYNDQHEPIGTVAVNRDISQQKEAEAALRELNATLEERVLERTAELERSNRELERFAYIASHDLKAPLRAIDHLAKWIAEDAADALPPASQEHLETLRRRVSRLEQLLDDLLFYARTTPHRDETELVDTRQTVVELLDLLEIPQGFCVTVAEEMPIFHTQRVPLEVVLRNLISNAVKHHNRADGHVQIAAEAHDDAVVFTVTDDGPGIEPQFHQRIFNIFETLQPRDKIEGSGMGLAVVKKTVESLGGTVEVVSTEGAGSTFRVIWPKH